MIKKNTISRIGKRLLTFDDSVTINFNNNLLNVKGPLGQDEILIPSKLIVKVEKNMIFFDLENSQVRKEITGTYNALINNILIGVTKGFEKNLEIVGVGYRCSESNKILTFRLGYSHLINLSIPADLKIEITKGTKINIKGINKYRVGWFAAKIRDFKRPEPYKGVGIKYAGEQIIRKEGKTAGK